MTVAPTTLSTLATEINLAHENVRRTSRESVMHALRAGALLQEAKQQVAYGQWQAWLRENFDGSYRTAALYVRMAERPEEVQSVAHLGIAGVQRHLAERRRLDPLLCDQLRVSDERDVAEVFDPEEPHDSQLARWEEAMGRGEPHHEPEPERSERSEPESEPVVWRREVPQAAWLLTCWLARVNDGDSHDFDRLLDASILDELVLALTTRQARMRSSSHDPG